MKKVTKILVPVDFSACSENALVYAMHLADKIKANLLLLNIPSADSAGLESPVSASLVVDEQIKQSRVRIKTLIQKVTESIRSSLDEVPPIQTNIEAGRVETTICDVAARNQVEYIVMGTQGENSTLDKYLGSVASNVLKDAPCPVIVVPENTEFAKKVVIGYATDFSDADPFEIWKAVKLFKPFQPIIKCVHFNEKQVYTEDKIRELELYFKETSPELNIEFYSLPVEDKVKDMNDFVEKYDINILVMYKPKRTFFKSLFHKSYTQKMASHTNVPLLVLKEKE